LSGVGVFERERARRTGEADVVVQISQRQSGRGVAAGGIQSQGLVGDLRDLLIDDGFVLGDGLRL